MIGTIHLIWRYILLAIFLLVISSCENHRGKNSLNNLERIKDSVSFWIKASKHSSTSKSKKANFLNKSYHSLKLLEIDTFKLRNLSSVAYQTLKLGDTSLFKKRNDEVLILAKKSRDTFSIGDSHWNYASYYSNKEVYDTAYYHFNLAYENFERSGYLYEAATTQYGMAFIRGRFRDYSGSEVLTFKAIKKFKTLNDNKSLYSLYNHLALLQGDILEYDRALFYHEKALKHLKKVDESENLLEASLNNIGVTYLNRQNYSKALKYFNKILRNDSLRAKNPGRYARVIDNKAYCKLLMGDTVNVINQLKTSLQIRDSLKSRGGLIISKLHLTHYYKTINDTNKAIEYAKEAKSLAKEIKNSRDYLASLKLLAELDNDQSQYYLKKYIQFNDSLQILDRKIQNKFTRIDYETDEYIEETKRLSQQRIWIVLTGFGVLTILTLIYFLKIQKSKSENLFLETEQQYANEQVYILTLQQQAKLETEKIKERNRISEELHDGILGKLFGARLGLGFLNFEAERDVKKQHQLFLEELQIIEKEIREVSHRLSENFDSSNINFIVITQQLLESTSKIGDFEFKLKYEETINWYEIDEIIKVNLYRIIQEALQNIIKYAKAENVIVEFSLLNEHLLLLIKDDGVGLDIKNKKKGIGTKNMQSRVEKLKGDFKLYSQKNEGVEIEIKIPIK